MKKTFAVLMLATMLFAVGCGNQAKEATTDAQQKVEQTANKATEDATAKVDEVKDAANKAADDAAAKVDEAANDLKDAVTGRTIALNGIMPGVSLEDIQAQFGEATSVEGDIMTFVNGLKVKFDDATKKVKEISTTDNTFSTPEGMYVGADEYLLNEYCGPADMVNKIANGAEYEYNSGDNKSKVVYTAQNGVITEITCAVK